MIEGHTSVQDVMINHEAENPLLLLYLVAGGASSVVVRGATISRETEARLGESHKQ